MKTFTFTLIIYILLLLTQPCQDTFAQGIDISNTDNVQQPLQDDPIPDDCSPFCICACRQVPSAYRHFTSVDVVEVTVAAIPATAFEYQNPYTKNFRDSIWQPPKA